MTSEAAWMVLVSEAKLWRSHISSLVHAVRTPGSAWPKGARPLDQPLSSASALVQFGAGAVVVKRYGLAKSPSGAAPTRTFQWRFVATAGSPAVGPVAS